jgi:hypothetical protein
MELALQSYKKIHSPLYDRRLMILILKKQNGRRSFSENCRLSKIKEEHRYGQNESSTRVTQTPQETEYHQKKQNEGEQFRSFTTASTENDCHPSWK